MMDSSYTLAIVMPCWNVEKYIGSMLDGILKQSFNDWKLFCVDDYSTDSTYSIIESYTIKDDRIKLRQRKGTVKGAQTCRNEGFGYTEGAKYVIFFDSDDLVTSYCFHQRVDYMESHKDLEFAIFPTLRCNETYWDSKESVWGYNYLGDPLKCLINETYSFGIWSVIYQRKSILSHNLVWDDKLLSRQDVEWNIQTLCKGMQYQFASMEGAKVDYFYRFVETSISHNCHRNNQFKSHLHFLCIVSKSLSSSQLVKYDVDLQCLFKRFAFIMANDAEAMKRFFSIEWLSKHKWFKLRLFFCCVILKGKGSKKCFPRITNYSKKIHQRWKEYQHKIIISMPEYYHLK